MPVPNAVISVLISSLPSILSARAFSTFRILPLSGRIACVRRSRPPFALPPAEGPSTMKSSHFSGSRSEQSASLPGSEKPSSAPLRNTSRALRAACGEALLDHALRVARVLLEILAERVVDRGGDLAGDLGVAQTRLRLTLELRLLDLHADDSGEAFTHVFRREIHIGFLQLPALACIGVDRSRECVPETGEVRAA